MKALPGLVPHGQTQRTLLIYVPTHPPLTDEAKQLDPFAAYGSFGTVFPATDKHSYLQLCLAAKADHQAEIRRLFEEDQSPAFELIDNIGGGLKWPTLRTLLGTCNRKLLN